jgi:transcriptional regulator with XRE-family HTH domain
MAKHSRLLAAPPYPVEQALKTLGGNLRIARLRRNLSLDEVAEKIGVNRKSVADAEGGKPSTGIGVYVALLWTFDLISQLSDVAEPTKDREGLTLALARERTNARKSKELDNDF